MNKIKKIIKKNSFIIVISIIFLIVMIYTSNNAIHANDDYPYSFFYRGTERITNIIQVIKNQVSDYRTISGRFITNGLGQFMLIFPRIVFSIMNALVTLISAILTYMIAKELNPKKEINKFVLPLIIGLFFLLDPTKNIIYWIMGSANYNFTMPLLLFFIWYVIKYGLFHKPIFLGMFICFASMTHESLLVFFIIFILSNIILDLLNKKPLNKMYLYYIVMMIIAGCVVFLAPGNRIRSSIKRDGWSELGLLAKLNLSIPVVAYNMFSFSNFYNLVPLIFTIIVMVSLYKKKDSLSNLLIITSIILYTIGYLRNDGWLYFFFSVVLFLSESYLHTQNKRLNLITISLGFYAIVYSMIITPEYMGGRPNYFMYWYMITVIVSLFNENFKIKKASLISTTIMVFMLLLAGREIYIYNQIGQIKEMRLNALAKASETNSMIVKFKKIPDDLAYYQIEANNPGEPNYWARTYFINYYHLNPNIYIILTD